MDNEDKFLPADCRHYYPKAPLGATTSTKVMTNNFSIYFSLIPHTYLKSGEIILVSKDKPNQSNASFMITLVIPQHARVKIHHIKFSVPRSNYRMQDYFKRFTKRVGSFGSAVDERTRNIISCISVKGWVLLFSGWFVSLGSAVNQRALEPNQAARLVHG